MFKNKKLILAGAVLVAAAIAVSSTFAWFTDSDEVINKMKLAKFDVKITEDWNEDEWQDLQPSTTVDKAVKVINNGTKSAKAVVRIKIEEAIKLFKNEDEDVLEVDIFWGDEKVSDTDTTKVPVPTYVFPDDVELKTVTIDAAVDTTDIEPINPDDSNTGDDVEQDKKEENKVTYYDIVTSLKEDDIQCYVAKIEDYEGLVRYNPETKKLAYAYYEYDEEIREDEEAYFSPVFNTEDWSEEIDGYYYYKKILEPGETTKALFSKVEVSDNLPNTYMGAIYKLTPKMEAVQADGKAIASEWPDAKGKISELIKGWGLEEVVEETPEEPTEPEETPTPEPVEP